MGDHSLPHLYHMKRLRFLSLSVLLALGSVASSFTPSRAGTEQASSYDDYQNGYTTGKRETEQNKCIDGNNFVQNYEFYRQRVTNYRDTALSPDDYDFYQGYLDGMEEGYNTPVTCGSPGPGPGPSGPTGGGGPLYPTVE